MSPRSTPIRTSPSVLPSLISLLSVLLAVLPLRAFPPETGTGLDRAVADVEARLAARVGVVVMDAVSGDVWGYRADERFPLTSTFKPLACAAVLERVDAGTERLDRLLHFDAADLVTYSPVTKQRVDDGITLAGACDAAITVSDNTAGNLLLSAIGGPSGLTTFLRRIGDDVSRLDRREPDLNEATPGDPRDTTTPRAMVLNLHRLLFGDVLTAASRDRLEAWLIADRVADALFRAHLPAGWTIGDKTGAGGHGSRALVAVIRPPGRSAVLAAVYITETEASFAERNAAIAALGAAIFDELSEAAGVRDEP